MISTKRAVTGRMLRHRSGGPLLIGLLCLVLAAIAAGVPVALTALGDSAVRAAAHALAPGERDLEATASGVPQAGPGATDLPDDVAAVWGRWDARIESIRDDIGDPLESLLAPAEYVTRMEIEIPVAGGDGHNSVALALDPRLDERAVIAEGSWPSPASTDQNWSPMAEPLEVAVSVRTAEELEWAVGEVRGDLPDAGGMIVLPLVLTGTFEAAPGSEDYWYHVPSVLTPRMWVDTRGERHVEATGFLHPAALAMFQGGPATTSVWYPFAADRMSASDAPRVLQQLREFTANSHTVGSQSDGIGGVISLTFRSAAMAPIETALATSRAMAAVIAITASAPVGVAIAVLALACRIVARDRRGALALLAARGASPGQSRRMLAAHGVVFGAIPAVLGGAVVWAIAAAVRIPLTPLSLVGPLVVAALPALMLACTPPPPAGLREEVPAAPSPLGRRLRFAVEAVVVVVAVLATAALISGSLAGARVGSTGSRAAGAGADLLVAAVPLLWGLVGCVVALRLYPVPLRALFARLRRGPGLVGFLGAARSLREPAAGVAPVLALVIGMSSAVTSGVLLGSIQHGIDTTAHTEVGADLQIARADLTPDMVAQLREIDGIAALAPLSSLPSVYVRANRDLSVMTLLLADPDELRAAQDSAHPLLPADADIAARDSGPIPVVLSARGSSGVDDAEEITIEGEAAQVQGIGEASAPAGISPTWVLVDAEYQDRLAGRLVPATTSALVALTPGTDTGAVEAAVREIVGEQVLVTTPAARAHELSTGTGAFAIRVALIAATVGVALLGALTVLLTLALGSRGRDRIVALLRVLGAPPRSAGALVAWELWPGVAAALVVGTAVGLALPALLLATVDLSAFTGASAPGYHLDPLLLGGAILGFLVVTALFTLIALALSRRVRAAWVLRTSQEG